MPKKGDDFDSITAAAAIEHNSNADIVLPDTIIIRGIYAREYVEIVGFEGYAPVVTVYKVDYLAAAKGDVISVNGKSFKLRAGPQSDGTGIVVLVLHEA